MSTVPTQKQNPTTQPALHVPAEVVPDYESLHGVARRAIVGRAT